MSRTYTNEKLIGTDQSDPMTSTDHENLLPSAEYKGPFTVSPGSPSLLITQCNGQWILVNEVLPFPTLSTLINSDALGVRVAQQMSLRQCKTRNFCAHFAETNTALVQKVNKKKTLVLKPSSRVVLKGPFKTASSLLKKSKLDSVFEPS